MARLLVVEDDADQRELRRMLLERAGHDVEVAAGAREAERACARRQPAVVVMDLRLPASDDGIALIRRLREICPALRIVVLSGFPADLKARPEARLVDAVVPKPCRSAKLMEVVSRLLVWFLCVVAVASPATIPFRVAQPAEIVADVPSGEILTWSFESK